MHIMTTYGCGDCVDRDAAAAVSCVDTLPPHIRRLHLARRERNIYSPTVYNIEYVNLPDKANARLAGLPGVKFAVRVSSDMMRTLHILTSSRLTFLARLTFRISSVIAHTTLL